MDMLVPTKAVEVAWIQVSVVKKTFFKGPKEHEQGK